MSVLKELERHVFFYGSAVAEEVFGKDCTAYRYIYQLTCTKRLTA